MLTRRGRALGASAGAMWFASRLVGVEELAIAAVAAAVLVVAALAYTMVASARLTADRSVQPSRLFFDATATVVLRVRNHGRVPTAILQVSDRAPESLADDRRFLLAPLAAGEGVTLRYRLHGRHRGRFGIGPLTVRLRDPFGIATRTHRFGAVDEVVVYPLVWRLPAGVPLGGRDAPGGEGRPRPLVSGDELANVRDYVRGDDLRKVHWRSTAHRAKLMVRQDEAPQHPHATLVLDRRAGAHHGAGPDSSFELAVSATASVAYHVAARSYAFTLLDAPTNTPPRPLAWQPALDELAVAMPDTVDLAGLWRQLAHGVAGSGVLAAVVTVPEPPLLREMVRAGRGFASRLAVLIDAESFRGRGRRELEVAPTAAALRLAGWRVTIVGRGDRLDEAWRELALTPRGGPVPGAGATSGHPAPVGTTSGAGRKPAI